MKRTIADAEQTQTATTAISCITAKPSPIMPSIVITQIRLVILNILRVILNIRLVILNEVKDLVTTVGNAYPCS